MTPIERLRVRPPRQLQLPPGSGLSSPADFTPNSPAGRLQQPGCDAMPPPERSRAEAPITDRLAMASSANSMHPGPRE